MQKNWSATGHEAIKSVLEKQLETKTTAQAYLFKGNESVGKKTLAYDFANKLLNTPDASGHPDFVSLGVEEDASVEKIRELIGRLSVKPFIASHTVAVVNNAHLLNASAGNALLKQLEEPAPSSVIILVASGSVLPTIASRCQTFIFNPARARNFSPEIDGQINELEKALLGDTAEKISVLKNFAELESDELAEVLLGWLYRVKAGLAHDPSRFKLAQALLSARSKLETNMNKKFILQQLLLET